MNDNGLAQNLIDSETVGQKCRKGLPAGAEKRRQISRVAGMGTILGIVMSTGVGKVLSTVAPFVDVKGKYPLSQSRDIGTDDHPAAGLIKEHFSLNKRLLTSVDDHGGSVRFPA